MTKTQPQNHSFGGSGAGVVGGGVLGVKPLSGVWCVPFTGISPMTVLSMLVTKLSEGAWAVLIAMRVFDDGGTNGFVGVCSVLVMRSAGVAFGLLFCGGFI
jgi:hypothetical protein